MADEQKQSITYNGYDTGDPDKTSLVIRRGDTVINPIVDNTESVVAGAMLDQKERVLAANADYMAQLRAKTTGQVRAKLPATDISTLIRQATVGVLK